MRDIVDFGGYWPQRW